MITVRLKPDTTEADLAGAILERRRDLRLADLVRVGDDRAQQDNAHDDERDERSRLNALRSALTVGSCHRVAA